MHFFRLTRCLTLLGGCCLLLQCGQTNEKPTAVAGENVTVSVGETVKLNGEKSSDPEGDPLSFQWKIVSKPDGSQAKIGNDKSPNTQIVADKVGSYYVYLTVSDGELVSNSSMVITAAEFTKTPVAHPGEDVMTFVGKPVTLDGSKSTGPLGLQLSYRWTLLGKPQGSQTVIEKFYTAKPSLVPDLTGDYSIKLTVSDGSAESKPALIVVTAVENNVIADAGSDRFVILKKKHQLDGSKSKSLDGDALTFKWIFVYQPAGSAAILDDETSDKPTFTPEVAGDYVLSLVATSVAERSLPATVMITAAIPVAQISVKETVERGDAVELDGSKSSAAEENAPLTYKWTLVEKPKGSAAKLDDVTAQKPHSQRTKKEIIKSP